MSDIGMQESFHYVILKGRKETPWLADECVKKRFLNQLLKEREKISFRVYAFCILDKEAHFLVNIPAYGDIRRTAAKMSQGLQKSYLRQYPQGKEKVSVSRKHLSPCSLATVLEYCCNIHLLARGYAGKIQDYWWSSYVTYIGSYEWQMVDCRALSLYFLVNLKDSRCHLQWIPDKSEQEEIE